MSIKYTQALAVAYNTIGDEPNFNIFNNKLASLGGGKIESNFIPQLIDFYQDARPATANIAPATSNYQEGLAGNADTNGTHKDEGFHTILRLPSHSLRVA